MDLQIESLQMQIKCLRAYFVNSFMLGSRNCARRNSIKKSFVRASIRRVTWAHPGPHFGRFELFGKSAVFTENLCHKPNESCRMPVIPSYQRNVFTVKCFEYKTPDKNKINFTPLNERCRPGNSYICTKEVLTPRRLVHNISATRLRSPNVFKVLLYSFKVQMFGPKGQIRCYNDFRRQSIYYMCTV